jgi:hypothetical protein
MRNLSPIFVKLLILIWWLAPQGGWAQADTDACRQTLDQAADQLRKPRLVIQMLSDSAFQTCYKTLSKGDRLRAYRLLTQAHLLLTTPQEAQALDTWENLLHIDPEYQLDPRNSSDVLIALSKQFINRPLLTFSFLQGGLHLPFIRSSGNYTTANVIPGDPATRYQASFQPRLSWHIGTAAWLNLNGVFTRTPRLIRWEAGLDVRYQTSNHAFAQTWWWLNEANNRFETTFEEQQTSLGLGLTMRYNFDPRTQAFQSLRRPIVPYLTAGVRWNLLQAATISDARLTNVPGNENVTPLAQGIQRPDISALRQSTAWAAAVSVGGKWKVDRHYLFAEIGLEQGLTNLVNPDNRYAQTQLLYQYGYVDPDWTATRLVLSVGFLFTQYRVKRK